MRTGHRVSGSAGKRRASAGSEPGSATSRIAAVLSTMRTEHRVVAVAAAVVLLLGTALYAGVPGADGEAGGKGAGFLGGLFRSSPTAGYAKWSDPATWGGQVPSAGDKVTVPAGKNVVLDVSPPPLAALAIEGTLAFGDADLILQAASITVRGTLRVGTKDAPFAKRARIVLTGPDPRSGPASMAKDVDLKGITVVGGTLDLHGEDRPGWTRLAATMQRGAPELTLERRMPWREGDRIVVTSTDFSSEQAETFTVSEVDGATLILDTAAKHSHWGTSQEIAGRTLDERAEVGLLSATSP